MTINEAIQRADELKPNAYNPETKADWIRELEGRISLEVLKEAEPVIPESDDAELLVPAPYDSIYPLYISAMIDFHNADYDDYNNSMVLFNSTYEAFARHYRQTHMPQQATHFINIWG